MENKIIEVLKQCYDPEIPIDLWSLGLIYEINAKELENGKNEVGIIMTLTTPGCMMGEHMANDIKQKLEILDEISAANVEITFDPPWEPSMMNDEARKQLGFDKSKIKVLIHQFISILKNGKQVKMSTRKATYITLDELINEVSSDVVRYFFIMRNINSHLNFDLDIARGKI